MYALRVLMAGILMMLAIVTEPLPALAAIDSTAPTTLAALAGTKGSDGWYTTPVTVTLTASDGAEGSGVAKTEYSLDNVKWQIYSAPVVLDKDGNQYIYFRSTDFAGNIETPSKSQNVKINQTGLVGWWKMDGDWKDASVIGNNGTAWNGVTSSTNAKIGALSGSFDGLDDYVSIPNNGELNSQNITIETWFLAKSFANANWNSALVNKGLNEWEEGYYGLAVKTNGEPIAFLNIGGGSSNRFYVTGTQVAAGTWHHLALTYDNTYLTLYVDGLKARAELINRSRTVNMGTLLFGRRGDGGYLFNGLIDDVRIYNRALSDNEILEYYRTNAVKSPTVNPVLSPTATPIITLSGTKESNTAIVVNGNILAPMDGSTSWQANYTLAQGANTLSITVLNSQNYASLPVTLMVVLDTTPPLVTATMPVNNAILKSGPGAVTFNLVDAIFPLNFTATLHGATVNVSGSNVPGTWSSSGSGTTGTVTFTPSAAFSDGQYKVTIKPTDALGNGSAYTLTFTIDSTPPVAPGIDPVTAPNNTTSKTVSGTKSSDSSSVIVGCTGANIGAVAYPTTTTWIVTASDLKEGSNTITAYAVDAAGNQSAMTTATINVDTIPPAVAATPAGGTYNSTQMVTIVANEPAVIHYSMDGSTPTVSSTMYSHPISIPAGATLKYFGRDLAGNDSELMTEHYVIDTTPPVLSISTLRDCAYTNNDTLNVAGTVTDDTGVKGIAVNGTAVPVNSDGGFSYALLLKNGVNIVAIEATDSAGNMAEDTRTVTLDQSAPVLAVITPADNSKTGKALLEVSGTVDETSTVTVKMNDTVQSALMDGGTFIATVSLEPGYNTIGITATDLAGNESSLKRTVVFDDQVPSLAVTVPNQDIRTNQSSLTIKGTVFDALTEVGVTISTDNGIFTLSVIDGTFEQEVKFAEEKTYGIVVTATNEVGTSASVQRNVIFDITPPALSIDPVTTPTSQPRQLVSGTREAGAAVTVTCTTATVGEVSYPTATTWLVDIFGLGEGGNIITAASADAAGNAVKASATVVLVSRPPQISITATPDVIWPPNHHMVPVTIAGGVKANGSDIKSVSISVKDEYGKFDYNNLTFGSTALLEAWCNGDDTNGRKYTITVVVTDRGGITTAKTATVIVPHDMSNNSVPKTTIDDDSKVTIADALIVLKMAVGLVSMDSKYLTNGYVASFIGGKPDGKINISDALLILKKCVGR